MMSLETGKQHILFYFAASMVKNSLWNEKSSNLNGPTCV